MVERYRDDAIFEYENNANKVVAISNRDNIPDINESTGEAKTLVGKKLHRFGDLALREKPPKNIKKSKNKSLSNQLMETFTSNLNKKYNSLSEEKLNYYPKTKDTHSIYDDLLNIVREYFTDQSPSLIKSALDFIILILRDEKMNEMKKKEEIEKILGKKIANEEINKLYILCKSLVDYEPDNINEKNNEKKNENIEIQLNLNDSDSDDNENAPLIIEEEEISDMEIENKNNKKEENENEENEINLTIESVLQNKLWLQNILREKLKIDEALVLNKEKEIMDILSMENKRECENKLVLILTKNNIELIKFLLKNKNLVYFTTKISKLQNKNDIDGILNQLYKIDENTYNLIISNNSDLQENTKQKNKKIKKNNNIHKIEKIEFSKLHLKKINLENIQFIEGSHFNSNPNLKVPQGTYKTTYEGYEEITIPPTQIKNQKNKIKEIKISTLPKWMHPTFQIKDNNNQVKFINETFNQIQSKVLQTALFTDENLLICAPTSSGKTNIALLTILHLISKYRNENNNIINLNKFKIIYIAPMKALVKETVGNFSQRLSHYNITVRELSGDVNLTKYEINNTNIIVTTPEKYDIITRKSGDRTFSDKVQLIIIDEIHLLHDTRGAVLESIIARTIMNNENNKENNIRLVALSATLPNYNDIADFCHVNKKKGLFYFDSSFRPIPLSQIYIGITEKKGIKKLQLINEITYNKVYERLTNNKQVIIFTHSRRDTMKTAKFLIEKSIEKNNQNTFKLSSSKQMEFDEIIKNDTEENLLKNKELLDIFDYGIGIHHAGMHQSDKKLIEEYFNNGYLKIIISTATLAWGINLPANTVIVKGTQIYNPEKGSWCELNFLDIIQMMGRAGRVGYFDMNKKDNYGEGIIITTYNELKFYLSLINNNLPIESQLISSLPDCLNAEIVSGNVSNVFEGANWLSYTYLFVRMMKNHNLYCISDEIFNNDNLLENWRISLIHASANLLHKNNLIKYNTENGEFTSTQLGKVSSYYYIKYPSIGIYNQYLNVNMSEIDILRLFSLSNEFKLIQIREEEKREIEKLISKVPIPVPGGSEEQNSKINILLQCYISNIPLDGYAISSDMVFISQNASRIFRAIFEICCHRCWANVSYICLKLCKEIKNRMWLSMSPLRQFNIIPEEILHKIESKEQLTWDKFFEMSVSNITDLIKINKKNSESIYKLIHTFPRIEIKANIQPLTRNCLFIEILINPNFNWIKHYHPYSELFHLFVEDNDSEIILHHEMFNLKEKDIGNEKRLVFIVPMIEPMPPQYFIRIISDNWLNCERELPIYFKYLILPEKFPPCCNLLEMNLMNYKNIFNNQKLEKYYNENYKFMNNIQSQCFDKAFNSNESIFIGATTGCGKTQIAEFGIIKFFEENKNKKLDAPVIYLCYNDDCVKEKIIHFKKIFKNKVINQFTGEFFFDKSLFKNSDFIISSFKNFDVFTSKFKYVDNFSKISLVIVDDIHLLNEFDCALEVSLSRLRYFIGSKLRFIILSTSLSNYNSICEWLDIKNENCFNFETKVRQNPIEFYFYGYESISHKYRMNLMSKNIFNLLNKYSYNDGNFELSTIIYVTDIKTLKKFVLDLLSFYNSNGISGKCLIKKLNKFDEFLSQNIPNEDILLITSLKNGIGYIYNGMDDDTINFIISLFEERIIQILIVPQKIIWKVNCQCHNVIIADTVKYDSNNGGYIDINITDMFQMVGRASITYNTFKKNEIPNDVKNTIRRCFIFLNNSKKELYKKFLLESFPVESSLNHFIHNHLLTEISNGIIKSKQECVDWITWTFFYRRLLKNPNYYDMKGNSKEFLNEYLSELIENTVNDLFNSGMINVKEDNSLEILNLGKISSNYYITYQTIDLFNQSFKEENSGNIQFYSLFQILKNSFEFDLIEFNKGDINLLFEICQSLNNKSLNYLSDDIKQALKNPENESSSFTFSNPHNKALILLISYISRTPIPYQLNLDMENIIITSVNLISSLVDVFSSKQLLKQSIYSMELSQMIIQAMWISQSPLMQLPTFNSELCNQCKEIEVEDISDFVNLDERDRNTLLSHLDKENIAKIANVCNRYPEINLEIKFIDDNNNFNLGETICAEIILNRTLIDNSNNGILTNVYSNYYPKVKEENWWIIIGDEVTNKLFFIRKLYFNKSLKIPVNFEGPESEGIYSYKVFLICDSWIGCDQEENFEFSVQ